MIVVEERKFPFALIVPSFTKLRDEFISSISNWDNLNNQEILQLTNVITTIENEINRINMNFGKCEQIKKMILIPNEFSIETGELTPTLKIKRKYVEDKFKNEIESIYNNNK